MKRWLLILVSTNLVLICQNLYAAEANFIAKLTAAQETHTVDPDTATGTAALLLTEEGLKFDLTVEGLSGPITVAHFHRGAAGVSGPPVRTITADFDDNTASGVWRSTDSEPLTEELVSELFAGNLYLNVHTQNNPQGEIRGQVNLSSGIGLSSSLTAGQETHTVDPDTATGTATLVLTDEGLKFNLTVEGLSGPITVAHFHSGAAGVSGPPVRTITADFDGNTASGVWRSTDDEPLTSELIDELLAGNLYLNVHTQMNAQGEIRGQVETFLGTGLSAQLTSAQETHTVDPDTATGTAALILTDDGLKFDLTVEGLSGPITMAHFHRGAVGIGGPPVRTITDDFVGNTASGTWRSTDSEPLTSELIDELLAGNLYLNVHTQLNGPGEIRGQVNLNTGSGLSAVMTAAQETHSVDPDTATGTAALTLTEAGLVFSLTVEGLSGPITVAHFHRGAMSVSGPPVRTITDDFNGNTASGVWRSSDGESLTSELIDELLAGNLYLNVHTQMNGQGEIRGQVNPSDVTVSVETIDDDEIVPQDFVLSQNYPNPFNPETTISYAIPERADVRLTVFNLLGQRVATLIEQSQPAGRYVIKWTGQDNFGRQVSSGVYMYKIEAGDFVQSKKMLVVR